jgi:surface protein
MNKINTYTIIAKDREDLLNIVIKEIETHGNKCNLNHIDVSHVTDMSSLFDDMDFNGDVSQWDVSNVVNMDNIFSDSPFNSDVSSWDVSNVKTMWRMFANSEFNSDISNWNVSNVKNMMAMFCHSEFSRDISQWDVTNVKNMKYMFSESKFSHSLHNWKPYKASTELMFEDLPSTVIPYWYNYDNLEERKTAIEYYIEKQKLHKKLNVTLGSNKYTSKSKI